MNKLDTILLISESQDTRNRLRDVLEESYNLLEAVNVQQALVLFRQNSSCIVSIVADITTTEAPESPLSAMTLQIPLILICQEETAHTAQLSFYYHAADIISIHHDPETIVRRIDTITKLYNHKLYLQRMEEEHAKKLQSSNDSMISVLSSIIEYRSVESGQHILRIRHFTKLLLEDIQKACPEYGLNDHIISIIASASALHDIGKIAIPDSILLKPGPLTPEERAVMETHAITGCRILESLQDIGNHEYLRYAHNICRYHHERWDGGGYPDGLAGDAIPLCAQVVGLVDVYDALTSKRVYKDAYSFESAVNMILKGECGIFSPKLLECFKHILSKLEALARSYVDGLSPKTESFDVTLPEPALSQTDDTLDNVQRKYATLLHYMNCFLMEVYVDQGHYHLRYNPYPEFSHISDATSFEQIRQLLMELVHPDEKESIQQLMDTGIEQFLNEGLRRQTFRFRFCSKGSSYASYDLTLLRSNTNQSGNRSLSVLCKKLDTEEFLAAAESSPLEYTFCCKNDRYFTLVRTGPEIGTLAGYTPSEIQTVFRGHIRELVHPDDQVRLLKELRNQFLSGSVAQADFRMLHKDGSIHWISGKNRLIREPDGQEYIYSYLTDISHHKQAYDVLQNKLDRYEIILAQTENVLFDWDIATDIISFSDTWEKIFGFPATSADSRTVLSEASFLHPDDVSLLMGAITNINNGSNYEMVEIRIATAMGRYLWCRFRGTAVRDENGKLVRICGIIINIDDEKLAEKDLQERAERDSLTKLLNKQAGKKQAEEYLSHYPNGANCALLIIDLDNFKHINDQYGHLFGDAVLTQATREIRKMFRAQDLIARIGGDEFMVLIRGISDQALVQNRCQRLIAGFHQAFHNPQQDLPLSCSIGIALSPQHGTSYYELFQHADQALYQAKAQGKNCFVFYSPQTSAIAAHKRNLTAVSNRIDSDNEPGLADSSLVQYAFHRLYSSQDVASSINEILSIVGTKMNVSRVYVFENSDDNRFCSNTYEWCNEGIPPEIQNLQNISYETDIPNYEDNFNEQGIFYCPDINDLPQRTYDIVAPQGIKSMLHCAIRENGVFRGYIGFDECVTKRLWTNEQIHMLSYFSDMLSVFLLKKREQDRALRHNEELHSILDNQNAWIYIIDPDTCQLKYLNAKTRVLAPNAKPGMYCYQSLMGNSSRCAGCPAENIHQLTNASTCMYSKLFDLHIKADATLIQWNGTKSCLLTCRQLLQPENAFFESNVTVSETQSV